MWRRDGAKRPRHVSRSLVRSEFGLRTRFPVPTEEHLDARHPPTAREGARNESRLVVSSNLQPPRRERDRCENDSAGTRPSDGPGDQLGGKFGQPRVAIVLQVMNQRPGFITQPHRALDPFQPRGPGGAEPARTNRGDRLTTPSASSRKRTHAAPANAANQRVGRPPFHGSSAGNACIGKDEPLERVDNARTHRASARSTAAAITSLGATASGKKRSNARTP